MGECLHKMKKKKFPAGTPVRLWNASMDHGLSYQKPFVDQLVPFR